MTEDEWIDLVRAALGEDEVAWERFMEWAWTLVQEKYQEPQRLSGS